MLEWWAREDNDAMVSLRQSLAAFEEYEEQYGIAPPQPVIEDVVRIASNLGFDDVAEQTTTAYLGDAKVGEVSGDAGELLVLIENGFIAYRAEEKVYIPILAEKKTPFSMVIPSRRLLLRRQYSFAPWW
jgi:hypothetical protein